MNTVTQTMQFRQSLLNYAEKGGVNRAAIKYNMNRNDIHSLANRLYRPIIRTSAQKRSFNGSQTFVGETQTQSWSFSLLACITFYAVRDKMSVKLPSSKYIPKP